MLTFRISRYLTVAFSQLAPAAVIRFKDSLLLFKICIFVA